MLIKTAIFTILAFFAFGNLLAMAADAQTARGKGMTQSVYSWLDSWDKGKQHKAAKAEEKAAARPSEKPAVKKSSRHNNITQSAYNLFGGLDMLCVDKWARYCKACEKQCCKACNIDCGGTCCKACVPRD